MKKLEKMFGEGRAILRLMVVTLLLLPALVGCAKPHALPDSMYEAKQVQRGGLETTYVICRGCVQYTKLK